MSSYDSGAEVGSTSFPVVLAAAGAAEVELVASAGVLGTDGAAEVASAPAIASAAVLALSDESLAVLAPSVSALVDAPSESDGITDTGGPSMTMFGSLLLSSSSMEALSVFAAVLDSTLEAGAAVVCSGVMEPAGLTEDAPEPEPAVAGPVVSRAAMGAPVEVEPGLTGGVLPSPTCLAFGMLGISAVRKDMLWFARSRKSKFASTQTPQRLSILGFLKSKI
jgi:hypothetical protein